MYGVVKHRWDDRKAVRAVTEYQKVYRVSVVRAVLRSLQWARTRVIREIAQSCGIDPQKLVRRRVRISVTNGTVVRGTISIHVNAISAIKIRGVMDTGVQSGMNRTGSGVRIHGRSMGRFYRDAFIAPGLGGHWQVFRRKGRTRLPIEAIKIPIREQARVAVTKWINESLPIAGQEITRQLALRRVSASVTAGMDVVASDGA